MAADGGLLIAYRLRTPESRGTSLVVATSGDGEQLETAIVLDKEKFGAESLERPAVVRLDDGWRLYVSCATPNTKHWRIDALDAGSPADFASATPRTVFAGDAPVGIKDPVIRRHRDVWHAWLCCHPLDQAGEEDRMSTAYATSADGLSWKWSGEVLSGRPGCWDARGARVTSVLPDGRASYDGRATKEENFSERTGVAVPTEGRLVGTADSPAANFRYLDLVRLRSGDYLAFFERPNDDGSHDLCMERIAAISLSAPRRRR